MPERSAAPRWVWVRLWLRWAQGVAWRSRPAARNPAAQVPPRGQRTPRASIPGRGEKDRGAEAFGVLRAKALDVVLVCDIDAARAELRIGEGRVDEVAGLDRDHATGRAVADEGAGDGRGRDRGGLVERVG